MTIRVVFLISFIIWWGQAIKAETLKSVTLVSEPFGYYDKSGNPKGILFDTVCRIATEAGYRCLNELYPFARLIPLVEHGSVDITMTLPHDIIKKIAIPVYPVVPVETVIISRTGTDFSSLSDLHEKTVGVLRGGRYDERFTSDHRIKKYETSRYDSFIRMLFANRLDAVIGTKSAILNAAHRFGYKEKNFGKPLIVNKNFVWLFLSKKNASDEKISRLKKAAEKLVKNGEIKRIHEQYK